MSKNQHRAQESTPKVKIILTGGGSGGHITPLLSLAHALKTKNPKCHIIYVGLKGEKLDNLTGSYKVFDEVCYVTSGKFRRYHGESLISHLLDVKTLFLNFRDLFKVTWGILMSLRLIGKKKPAVVFSKGAYVALPLGIAAAMRKVPIITHDSDAVAGLTNKIIGRWAKYNATGMPPRYYPYPKSKVLHTGIPVDKRVGFVDVTLQKTLKKRIGVNPKNLVLLIAGGGHGSKTINDLVVELSPKLLADHPSLQIIHFTGSGHQDDVADQYMRILGKEMPSKVKVIGFTSDFYAYSGAADVVLARAGATTLAELALQGKAAVVIPSPFLTAGHQLKNADELTTHGAAEVLPNDVKPQKLLSVLNHLLENKQRRQVLAHNIGSLARPNAAKELADILLEAAAG